LLRRIESAILRSARGAERFQREFPALLRQAIDEVIDSRRSGRFTLGELEKTELTYIGTKVEILLRNFLKVERGSVLDLKIDGIEVDVKNTVRANWTIPLEAAGHPCILIRADERRALCWFGLILINDVCLNKGKNRDQKRTIAKLGIQKIRWLLESQPYPPNFWEQITSEEKKTIISPRGGTERVAALFATIQGKRISRNIVESLTQQMDYMKRIRKNGGARDLLSPRGIAILWGGNDRALIEELGLPSCSRNEFISFKPVKDADTALLRRAGHID
jgi:hypothetical protein